MSEFFFNFKDLTNIQNPNKQILNLSSFIISDDYLKKLFPKRYNFYMKFIDGFSSPSNLYKYLYTTKESKDYYEDLQNKLAKVSNALFKLTSKNKKKVLDALHSNLSDAKNKQNQEKFIRIIENVINKNNNIRGGEGEGEDKSENEKEVIAEGTGQATGEGTVEATAEENENKIKALQAIQPFQPSQSYQPSQSTGNRNKMYDLNTIDNDYNKNYYIKKTFKPMESFLNDVKKIAPVLNMETPKRIDEVVKNINTDKDNNFFNAKTTDISDKVDELKQLYNNYLKNPLYSPERLTINIYDRLTFIGITYIIRFITLQFIYWGLNSNIINNFNKAFIYYTIIYILFFIFITSIVNVIFYYPILELFSNVSILTVFPNYLYYFYVYTNGVMSLLIHLFIILILLFIPFILVMDRKEDIINGNNNNISYDYKKKNEIYISISNFSLIIWVLTSIISLKF